MSSAKNVSKSEKRMSPRGREGEIEGVRRGMEGREGEREGMEGEGGIETLNKNKAVDPRSSPDRP